MIENQLSHWWGFQTHVRPFSRFQEIFRSDMTIDRKENVFYIYLKLNIATFLVDSRKDIKNPVWMETYSRLLFLFFSKIA
jgi:hypothetical protein